MGLSVLLTNQITERFFWNQSLSAELLGAPGWCVHQGWLHSEKLFTSLTHTVFVTHTHTHTLTHFCVRTHTRAQTLDRHTRACTRACKQTHTRTEANITCSRTEMHAWTHNAGTKSTQSSPWEEKQLQCFWAEVNLPPREINLLSFFFLLLKSL